MSADGQYVTADGFMKMKQRATCPDPYRQAAVRGRPGVLLCWCPSTAGGPTDLRRPQRSSSGSATRNWLLAHPVDARRYEDDKRLAAAAAVAGTASYNSAKTAIVQELVDLARTERGLPLVPVSDK
jgi:GrpB-like predicted nucleotidyltransferase (UPF0157 family)